MSLAQEMTNVILSTVNNIYYSRKEFKRLYLLKTTDLRVNHFIEEFSITKTKKGNYVLNFTIEDDPEDKDSVIIKRTSKFSDKVFKLTLPSLNELFIRPRKGKNRHHALYLPCVEGKFI